MSRIIILLMVMIAGMAMGLWLSDRWWGKEQKNADTMNKKTEEVIVLPEISGWVAWWKETEAYDLIASRSGQIKTVSPVWWLVNDNLDLDKVGKTDRTETAEKLKSAGVMVYPTLGSELTGKKLSPLFADLTRMDKLIAELVRDLIGWGAVGLDVDLEGIDETDREKFTEFLTRTKTALQAADLKLSVTIQAQDGKNFWFGAKGQDIGKIGQIADEVRIMIYDRHSASSEPGPIAPLDWTREVIDYNLKFISREKIVAGIPAYGYIWPKNGQAKGWSWDEFWPEVYEKGYSSQRDELSGELLFLSDNFSGWLADAIAMKTKVKLARTMGINRFVIWHLGGMDEEFFDTTYK